MRWSLRDGDTLSVPARRDEWIEGARRRRLAGAAVREARDRDRRRPPAVRRQGIATAVVEFATMLGGKPRLQRKAILRAADAGADDEGGGLSRSRYAGRGARDVALGQSGKTEGRLEVARVRLSLPDAARPDSRRSAGGERHERRRVRSRVAAAAAARAVAAAPALRAADPRRSRRARRRPLVLPARPRSADLRLPAVVGASGARRCGAAAVLVRALRRPTAQADAAATASITQAAAAASCTSSSLIDTPERTVAERAAGCCARP